METETKKCQSGFIALVGRPNCGKSTLLNRVLGEELAIVSPLPQTTRRNMRGIYNGENFQLIFVDTPGIHAGKHLLNKVLYEQGTGMFHNEGIDLICYLVDISREPGLEEREIAQMVIQSVKKICVIFNKVDLCVSPHEKTAEFFKQFPALETRPHTLLSALSLEAKECFLKLVFPLIPEGPRLYPDGDSLTDKNMRFFAAEFIRKQVINLTKEEVPHAACVEILEYKEFDDRHEITAVIHVETDGQKAIVIGKGGAVIAKIKKHAQTHLKRLAGVPVKIDCRVKVSGKWRDNKSFLANIGLLSSENI
jgi:GTP-binding protein Era